ncbi:unnamed protein product [Alopecurus aequalis]
MSLSAASSSSRACRPVALLLLLLLLSLSSLAASAVSGADASAGQHRPARRLLVSQPSTHKSKQRMWVGGEKKPFQTNAGASLGKKKIPARTWNPIHNR